MTKIIRKIRVNAPQLAILLQHKDKQFELKKEVQADLFPPLVEAIRQIRELTQNIALIAGAIASFIIPVINTSFVQTKSFGYASLVFLFVTICYAIHHLTEVIPKEVSELSRQHSTFMTILDDEIDRVNTIIESGNFNQIVHSEKENREISKQIDELKSIPRPDKSLNILRALLTIALLLLTLSFIPALLYETSLRYLVHLYLISINYIQDIYAK